MAHQNTGCNAHLNTLTALCRTGLALAVWAAIPAQAQVLRAQCEALSGWIQGAGAVQSAPCSQVQDFPPEIPRHAEARASSRNGILRSFADLSFDDAITAPIAQGLAWWRQDGVVINAADPALQGTYGRLHYGFRVNGSVDAQGAASAQLFLNNQYAFDGRTVTRAVVYEWDTPTSAGYQTRPGENYIPFIFGEAFSIQFYLNALVTRERGFSGGGDGFVSYDHTAYWNGVTGIADASGAWLSDASVDVPGGFDLMAAVVPEPGTPWLLGAGLLAVALRRHALRPASTARP